MSHYIYLALVNPLNAEPVFVDKHQCMSVITNVLTYTYMENEKHYVLRKIMKNHLPIK